MATEDSAEKTGPPCAESSCQRRGSTGRPQGIRHDATPSPAPFPLPPVGMISLRLGHRVILSAPACRHRCGGRDIPGQQEDGMEQRFALPVLAALAVTALFGCLTLPAIGDVAKPGTLL